MKNGLHRPLVILLLMFSSWLAADNIYTDNRSRQALKQPLPELTDEQLITFAEGRGLFDQMWVIAPSQDNDIDGLGPLFNSISCLQCHQGNGRGHAPDGPEQKLRSMLVRLSQLDADGHIVTPHPLYGEQLQDQAIAGVLAEGKAEIHYREFTLTLADNTQVSMRKPHVVLTEPAYGDFSDVITSARIGPALIGMGLLEAISAQDIMAAADPDDHNNDGISGRVHWLENNNLAEKKLGRFGYKANKATLKSQIANAFHADLGITSSLHAEPNCSAVQITCQQAINGGDPELSDDQLDAVTAYIHWLAVPKPLPLDNHQLQRGQQVFVEAQCIVCHHASYTTPENTQPKQLANKVIWPYSDFLLHDMGSELADNRSDGNATGQEWRTAPLWGIGVAKTINNRANYLHDGRARTMLEALLWHGGEAEFSKNQVMSMPTADRQALLAFLKTR